MTTSLRRVIGSIGIALLVVAPACSKEDRPGQVTTESSDTDGSGTHTGSGSGTGETGSGTGETGSGTGASTAAGDDHDHDPTTTTAFKATQASDAVPIEAREYSFVGAPATITGPRVFFTLTNKGREEHEMEVYDADGKEYGEIPELAPGAKGDLAVELQPGTYTIKCLVKDGTKTHEELGMKATFAVT
ncbi:MAG TPA: hypothetical protein VM030_03930 [Acidimicrobiales bacterium]|nr:hypothetical protein [Acidimicrobiales bacterium]